MAAERRDYAMYWRERAACLHEDPDLFFPIGTTGPTLEQIDEAKAVCRRCPVVEQCLDWVVQVGQVDGIWGGMTANERALRRREARRAKGTVTTAA